MRIVCPSCAAEYEVPALRLKPGKLVRCARCGSSWLPELDAENPEQPRGSSDQPPADAEADASLLLPGITAMDRLTALAVTPQPRDNRLIAAWVATFVVLAGAAAATIGWRNEVVRIWPPSGRILAASGPTQSLPGQTAGKQVE